MKAIVTRDPYRTLSEGSTVFVKKFYKDTKSAFLTTSETLAIPDHMWIDKDNWCLCFKEEWFTLIKGDEE